MPAPSRYTPKRPLADTTLPAPEAVPPRVLPLAAPRISMPSTPFPKVAVPAGLRPIRLPWTTFPLLPLSVKNTPKRELAEMTLPPTPPVPPMVLLAESTTVTPSKALGKRTPPEPIPRSLPWTSVSLAPLLTSTPKRALSATILPAPGLVPPRVLPGEPMIATPSTPFPRFVALAALVPTRLPWITLPELALPAIKMPPPGLPATTLPAPAKVPPMRLSLVSGYSTRPPPTFPRAAVLL